VDLAEGGFRLLRAVQLEGEAPLFPAQAHQVERLARLAERRLRRFQRIQKESDLSAAKYSPHLDLGRHRPRARFSEPVAPRP